ncbi:hypothetical protein [Clostridium sp.]|nr:hypothetical protein [Clostridium sp.]
MKFIYYIIHTIIGCKEEDLEYKFNGNLGICSKCGRKHFIFKKY